MLVPIVSSPVFENGQRNKKTNIGALSLESLPHFRERDKVAEAFRQCTFSLDNSSLFGFFGNGQLSLIFGVPNCCAFSLLVLCLVDLSYT